MQNRILLENYFFPGELKVALQRVTCDYNHERYYESLNNLTPADVFYGCGPQIWEQRDILKCTTVGMRGMMHDELMSLLNQAATCPGRVR